MEGMNRHSIWSVKEWMKLPGGERAKRMVIKPQLVTNRNTLNKVKTTPT